MGLDGDQLFSTGEYSSAQGQPLELTEWETYRLTTPAEVEALWARIHARPNPRDSMSVAQLLSLPMQTGLRYSMNERAPVTEYGVHIANGVVTWTLFDAPGDVTSVTEFRPAPGQTKVLPASINVHPWRKNSDPRIVGPMEVTPEGKLVVRTQKGTIEYDLRRGTSRVYVSTKAKMSEAERTKVLLRYSGGYSEDNTQSPIGGIEFLIGRLWRNNIGYEYWDHLPSESKVRMRLYANNGERIGFCDLPIDRSKRVNEAICQGEYFDGGALTVHFTGILHNGFVRSGKRWRLYSGAPGSPLEFRTHDGVRLMQADWPNVAYANIAAAVREDRQIARENERIRRRNRERNNAEMAAVLRRSMASLQGGGGNAWQPSTPGEWARRLGTPGAAMPTISTYMTPRQQAELAELERYRIREEARLAGTLISFAPDTHARADVNTAPRDSSASGNAGRAASSDAGNDTAEADRLAEEARKAEDKRKAEDAARADKARRDKLAADEAKRKRDAEERAANAPVEWKEGVVLCEPARAPSRNATCHGPLQTTYGILGEQSGITAAMQACGGNNPVRELGQAGGYIAFGCGWGTHPDKPNSDVPARLGVGYVPGRGSFHCSRKQTTVCTSY